MNKILILIITLNNDYNIIYINYILENILYLMF